MLHRFRSVEEIGRFAKLTHKAEAFTRLSLIFARNGYGKSTLCSILRSAADGSPHPITARKRLGAINDSRVDSLWASGATIAYSAGTWNACPGRVHIFDLEYVSKNLHLGDSVTRENKRSLLPIVLGDEGVALAEKVNGLDSEQRDVDDSKKAQGKIILARCKGLIPNDLLGFCQADIPEDLEARTVAQAQKLELARQAAVVKQKRNPPALALGSLAQAEAILAEGLEGVGEAATTLVQQHLTRQALGDRGQGWLEYGAGHSAGLECPYCGQDTTHVPLVAAYRTYFSDAFKALQSRIDQLDCELDALSPARFNEHLMTNDADFAYWSKLCEIPTAPGLSENESSAIMAALTRLKSLVVAKRKNPLEPIALGSDAEPIRDSLKLLSIYNERVAACGAVIDRARDETANADVPRAEANLAKWLAMAEKLNEPVKSAVADFLSAEVRLAAIKAEKAEAQNALKAYTTTTMAARQTAVNDILSDFGASFRVVDAKTSFVGREPNTEFAIELGTHRIKAAEKSETEPSFKTVLSAGDKSTLALAFFLAQIDADPALADAVVVFDDPFSSQDMDRQFQTTSYIRSLSGKACQTIVLSHDPRFLQLIEKNADNSHTRTFQLQCSDAGIGALAAWSSTDELKSLYLQQHEMIREYATHQTLLKQQTLNTIHQAIRPFLEDYLRLRFPGRFGDQAYIFEMANAIKGAGDSDPMAGAVSDLFALNEYTRPNMHGGGTTPAPGELRAHCKKVIAIVGSF